MSDHEYRDKIEVHGLRLLARHGVLEFEKQVSQPFEIDIALYVDLRAAGQSDDLNDTVSYVDVINAVKAIVEQQSHSLIEKLAELIADSALADERVTAVDVTVRKPHAAVEAHVDYSGVSIHRT